MPNQGIIDSFAKQSNKSKEEVERLWNDTEKIIKQEYPDKNDEDFYRLVVGVLKKRLGIEEEDATITTTSMGGPSAQYRTKVLNTVSRFGDFKDMNDWGKTTSDVGHKKKKKNESYEQAVEYIDSILSEMDSDEMKRYVKDYEKAEIDLVNKAIRELRKKPAKGPQKKKNIAASKVFTQKIRELKGSGGLGLTSDDVVNSEIKNLRV